MKIFITMLLISFNAFAFFPLEGWKACENEKCFDVKAGDDLYLKTKFKSSEATYFRDFNSSEVDFCAQTNNCWLFLGSIGDQATVKLNGRVIAKYDSYSHFESVNLFLPTDLITQKNHVEIVVKDLNQTRFGLRSPDTGIGTKDETFKKFVVDLLLRTGGPLLSAFTLFVFFIGFLATYTIHRNKKTLPLIFMSFTSVLYLVSFSEIPRRYFDPIIMSGPIHFTLRLLLDLSIVIVALTFYKPHLKIRFLNFLPFIYAIPISVMLGGWILGVQDYHFFKTTLLIAAPLVAGGSLVLSILAFFYFDRAEKKITFPLSVIFLSFQIYDLLIFWEILKGSFIVKWYLPFFLILFAWIYIRRSVLEVSALKVDALVGDQVKKIIHDLASPFDRIKSLLSVGNKENSDILNSNLKELEGILNSFKGESKPDTEGTVEEILTTLAENFKDKIQIKKDLWTVFSWYSVDSILFSRLFSNFITNAIKAGATEVSFNAKYSNRNLVIEISDNGRGIQPNLQPYIFQKGTSSNFNDGQGLGLSFVKESLEIMDGTVKLKSSDHDGTIFSITLPFTQIALIDDNPLVVETWDVLAKKNNLDLIVLGENDQSETHIHLSKFTPVFVDYQLSGKSGLDVALNLIKSGFKRVIITTGYREKISANFRQVGKNFPLEGI